MIRTNSGNADYARAYIITYKNDHFMYENEKQQKQQKRTMQKYRLHKNAYQIHFPEHPTRSMV